MAVAGRGVLWLSAALALCAAVWQPLAAAADDPVARGKYLARAGLCIAMGAVGKRGRWGGGAPSVELPNPTQGDAADQRQSQAQYADDGHGR